MSGPQVVRCGNCDHWLGESLVELVYVGHITKDAEPTIAPPRDLRYCKSCGSISVFVSRADLENKLAGAA